MSSSRGPFTRGKSGSSRKLWPWGKKKRSSRSSRNPSAQHPPDGASVEGGGPRVVPGQPARASRTEALSKTLTALARTILILIGISIASVSFPFEPWSPEYYLRLSQFVVDYSPVLLLALALTLLAGFFEPKRQTPRQQRTFARQICSIGLVVYLSLIPLQAFCFAWLWLQSDSQVRATIGSAETRFGSLRDRIRTSNSQESLRAAFADSQALLPPAPAPISLQQQKQSLTAAIDRELSQMRVKLNQARMRRISILLGSTLRGMAGCMAMAAGLRAAKRLL